MAKDPAFLFYSADFINGVSDLTYEERGQYITMLCIQHQKGTISSKWLSINLPNASSDVLSKFIEDEEGNYYNQRLQDEVERRSKYAPKKKAAAILGGLISANKVTKEHSKKIRLEFNINDFLELSDSEMKLSISKWFKHMLNLLENETETETESITVNDIEKRKEKFKQQISELDFSKATKEYFFEYWSEPNKSNKKMRFELEKTWDTKRRLKRWESNNFGKKSNDTQTIPKYQPL